MAIDFTLTAEQKKVIMPAGAGTGDRMRIGAAVRS
jgi:hypothetical protein